MTTSFPVNGKFTPKQKQIYDIVLKCNRVVLASLKPGVNWKDMHLLSERTMFEEFLKLGLVIGSVDEMMEQRLGFIFMPCGLGHFIGLDVHDVGGYMKGIFETPERDQRAGLKNLRTARELHPNMVITIEPGIYFRDFLLDGDFDKEAYPIELKFLNLEKIREYQKEVQGVRIEDVVAIT